VILTEGDVRRVAESTVEERALALRVLDALKHDRIWMDHHWNCPQGHPMSSHQWAVLSEAMHALDHPTPRKDGT
jgi:hypothetical protein